VTVGEKTLELRCKQIAALDAAKVIDQSFGHHFGPLLDAAKCPDALEFDIIAPPGTQETADGWILQTWDGVPFGLSMRDWKSTFGEKALIGSNSVAIDLTEAKTEAIESAKTINLDPSILLSPDSVLSFTNADMAVSLASIVEAGCILFNGTETCTAEGSFLNFPPPFVRVTRAGMRFTNCPTATASSLHLRLTEAGTFADVLVAAADLTETFSAEYGANYGGIKTGRDADANAGLLVASGDEDRRYTFDLDLETQYADTTDLGLSEYAWDVGYQSVSGYGGGTVDFEASGDDAPYLDVILAANHPRNRLGLGLGLGMSR